uniref:RING-type domain-containing protein n=1 Tax=viral metagenome TaxID=1070528 RepID=A0A6C0E2M4_9ZZZZ
MSFYRNQSFNNRNLSYNDVIMLEFYTQQYNDTCYRISQLQRSLDRINENINRIYFADYRNNNNNHTSFVRNRNTSRTRHAASNPYLFEPISLNRTSRQGNDNTSILNQRDALWTNLMSSFFSNVPVFPTMDEIRRASTVVRYRDVEDPLNDSCPISLERFTEDSYVTQLNYCGHLFNTNELNIWFETNVRCPVCRHDIRTIPQENASPANSSVEADSSSSTTRQTSDPLSVSGRNTTFTSELITRITDQLIHSLYGENAETDVDIDRTRSTVSETSADGSRILYDASNNTFLFETYIPLYRDSRN